VEKRERYLAQVGRIAPGPLLRDLGRVTRELASQLDGADHVDLTSSLLDRVIQKRRKRVLFRADRPRKIGSSRSDMMRKTERMRTLQRPDPYLHRSRYLCIPCTTSDLKQPAIEAIIEPWWKLFVPMERETVSDVLGDALSAMLD
jgi:hypothetical protein